MDYQERDAAYSRMIESAAAAFNKSRMVQPGLDHGVWAVTTTAAENGWLHVGTDYPAADLARTVFIRPRHYPSWGAVPYSATAAVLRDALRDVSVYPVHGCAAESEAGQ